MTLHQSDGLNPPKGTLQQIASLLCKFVQAINSVSLGVPIWQQEWLESRTPATCHLGPGWEQHHNEARNYVLLLPPLCSCPLFPSILLLMPTSVPSVLFFGDVVTRCECWRQSQSQVVWDGGLEIASVSSFIGGHTCHHHQFENSWFRRWNMHNTTKD